MAADERLTTLTEQSIRDRLQLNHPCLGDVRSLSLPGTIKQRIAHLGDALNNFVRLKSLDLSYNALVSVEAVKHLKKLERLILYHNLIPSLEEVKVLFGLSALKELDFRLNPLTKSFPHYRPYLIHAMPNLCKLDNCLIRETERKASSMSFSSDMFYSENKSFPIATKSQRNKDESPRLASRQTTGQCVTDGNDTVLNFVETNPADQFENITNSDYKKVDVGNSKDLIEVKSLNPKQDSAKMVLRCSTNNKESKGFHVNQGSNSKGDPPWEGADQPKVSFGPHIEKHPSVPGLGSLKHSRRAARGYFTPNPDQSLHHCPLFNVRPPSPRNPDVILSDPSNHILHPPRLMYSRTEQSFSLQKQEERKKRGGYRKPLEMFLNLIKQHWMGEQSVHHNNFLSQAVQILSMMESDISSRETEVKTLLQEVDTLSFQAASQEEEHKTVVGNLSAQLEEARQVVGKLNTQLRTVLEENVALQKQLLQLERQSFNSTMKSSQYGQIRGTQRQVEELRKEIEGPKSKIDEAEEVREWSDKPPQISGDDQ